MPPPLNCPVYAMPWHATRGLARLRSALVGSLGGLLSLTPGVAQVAPPPVPLMVMEAGRQFAHGSFPRSPEPWLGLFCEAQACELRKTPVLVSDGSAVDILEQTVKLDVLGVNGSAVALFPQVGLHVRLQPGPVPTWYRAVPDEIENAQTRALNRLGKWTLPGGAQPMTLTWVKTPEGKQRYHLALGATKQYLFQQDLEGKYGGDTTPRVDWVGDLDGDGRTDFLVTLPDDNCGVDERLYLSGSAEPGKLVRKAAQLVLREAACGC